MKRLIAMVACVAMVGALCGCEDGSSGSGDSTPVVKAESTGVVPALGSYSMSVGGTVPSNGYWYQTTFDVIAPDMISYSSDTFAHYSIPIHDGGVSFSNGLYSWILNGKEVTMQDTVNCAPSDGFAFYAKWTTPSHCEGIVWFGGTNGMAFVANR